MTYFIRNKNLYKEEKGIQQINYNLDYNLENKKGETYKNKYVGR